MQIIGNVLQEIANELDLIYVRAINVNDLNQIVQDVKVDRPLLVYANMSPIDFDTVLTNYEIARIETTILVIDLHKTADPTAGQIDELLAPLLTKINFVYDLLTRSEIVASAADVERESLKSADSIEMTDEVLGGYEMVLTIPIARQLYNCDDGPEPLQGTFGSIQDNVTSGITILGVSNLEEWSPGMNIHIVSIDGSYDANGTVVQIGSNMVSDIPYTVNAGPGTITQIL